MHGTPKKFIVSILFMATISTAVYAQNDNPWANDDTESGSAAPAVLEPAPVNAPAPEPVVQPANIPTNEAATTSRQTARSNDVPPSLPTTETKLVKSGIGFQTGVRFHNPENFNNFVTDVWNSLFAGYVALPLDEKKIGPGVFLTLNGTFDIGNYFQITPFAQGMWAGKWFFLEGARDEKLSIQTYTALAGVDLWGRVLRIDRYSLRLGAGAYGTHTIASFAGAMTETKISGRGYGFRGLAGTELKLTDHFTLTLDGSYPFGMAKLKVKGSVSTSGRRFPYPTKFEHSGFEICPGVVYYF